MKKTILIVDDEENIRYAFGTLLTDAGYDVATASDYNGALAKVSEVRFEVIFADIILGGKTGIDFLRRVKKRSPRVPVIMITGAPNISNASESLRLGAFDYLVKPIRKETLLRTTQLALRHKAMDDEKETCHLNLEAVFRSVKDGIISVNRNLEITATNDAALKKICQFTGDTVQGKSFVSIEKSCKGRCIEVFKETIRRKEFVEINNFRCLKTDKIDQTVTLTSSPLMNSDGAFTGAVMVIKDETRLVLLEENLKERQQFFNIVGKSKKMQQIYSLIEALADVPTTVLVLGESGTGKELVGDALHNSGKRKNRPLVKVNCSALSENLLESELFGHVKGAFTGAVEDKVGRFQKADGGTLFLDEIGDISPMVQLRLLRVLQNLEFEKVGASTPIKVDIRIIAATNQNLAEKVRSGEFRKDLYYRLKVMELVLPPLRDRREDIPFLTKHFLKKYNKKFNNKIVDVSIDVQEIFMNYPWPGNIRELEHTMEHAFILCSENTITCNDLPRCFKLFKKTNSTHSEKTVCDDRKSIVLALEKTSWNKSRAAHILGMSRKTLYRKLEKYNISTEQDFCVS